MTTGVIKNFRQHSCVNGKQLVPDAERVAALRKATRANISWKLPAASMPAVFMKIVLGFTRPAAANRFAVCRSAIFCIRPGRVTVVAGIRNKKVYDQNIVEYHHFF